MSDTSEINKLLAYGRSEERKEMFKGGRGCAWWFHVTRFVKKRSFFCF